MSNFFDFGEDPLPIPQPEVFSINDRISARLGYCAFRAQQELGLIAFNPSEDQVFRRGEKLRDGLVIGSAAVISTVVLSHWGIHLN